MKDFPVDIVYTWVDGNDKSWISKKKSTLKKYGIYHNTDDVSGTKRFANKNELKYSLRSIEKYCSWVRNIYIVTDNQVPKWLNTKTKNLQIIDHKEIFDNGTLPTFNSNAIEIKIKSIKGISNNFISLNDDFFFGKKTSKSDFFYDNGLPKIFVGKSKSKLKLKLRLLFPKLKKMKAHASAVYNSRKIIFNKYNKIINYNLSHSVKPLNKNIMDDTENIFFKELKTTLNNQFRDKSDVWIIALCAYYQLALNISKPYYLRKINKIDFLNKIYTFLKIKLNYGYVDLSWPIERVEKYLHYIEKYKPFTFCLNDWPHGNGYTDKIITDFLDKLFPKKSKYEK